MPRNVIDPVTRAGGNLRVEFTLDGSAISDAWVSGMSFRGIELALAGRDPRDAWTLAERICGTCSGVHALASVRAVENALGIRIPVNARIIRNLLAGTLLVRDHVMSLYLTQLPDWVDTKSATTADVVATAALAARQADRPNASAADFAKVRDRLAAEVGGNHPTVLGNGWWGHPAYRLAPEQNLLLAAHMLEALDWQREFMRLHTLLGGKDPHPQSYLVGGMAVTPPWGGPSGAAGRDHPQVPDRNAPEPLSPEGFAFMEGLVKSGRTFVTQVFAPDVALLAGAYPEWVALGAGPGDLSAGEYPANDASPPELLFPTGRLDDGNLEGSQPVADGEFLESVGTSWYRYGAGNDGLLGGGKGETTPAWPGLALPLQTLEGATAYSWVKAARYRGVPMEVGPLARVLVGLANGRKDIAQTLATALGTVNLRVAQLPGVIGRLVARSVEADVVTGHAAVWLSDLKANLATGDIAIANVTSWDPESWPSEAHGFSLGEGPRGAVAHWVTIRDKVVADYQVIDASTWNLAPRDASGGRGPLEAALRKTPVSDPQRPIEALRVVHSFAPCAGCAAHTFGPRRDVPGGAHRPPPGGHPMTALDDIRTAPGTASTQAAAPVHGEPKAGHGHPVIDRPHDRVGVYIWQVPVRITHWVTAICIVTLSLTGGYIADPFLIPPGGHVMTTIRMIHIIAALTFLVSGAIRTVYLLFGNRFVRWTAFIPTNRKQFTELFRQAGFYGFVRSEIPKVLGHNQLAAAAYLALFGLLLVETVTGFALDGLMGAEPGATGFAWLRELFGPQMLRLVHHLSMWLILAIALFHVYSCVLVDHIENVGVVTSMFTGFKFPTREEVVESRDGGVEVLERAVKKAEE